jgi:DNA primase catalytic core, N-terminal domain
MINQFKDRLMFLAYDRAANGVGFVGRGRGQVARYLNTAITPIYEKSKTLVGLGEQKKLACSRRHSRQRSRPAVSDMSPDSAEATLGQRPQFDAAVVAEPARFVAAEARGLTACTSY